MHLSDRTTDLMNRLQCTITLGSILRPLRLTLLESVETRVEVKV